VASLLLFDALQLQATSVKVAITLEQETLRQVDSLVARRVFQNRSRAILIALQEKIDRVEGGRLAAECAKH
jgi:metal-responsive CopG/Arc/MetJ family transcriptional regulator